MVINDIIIDHEDVAALENRFWSKVSYTDTCWHWLASQYHGYGRIRIRGKTVPAHRVAWVLTYGALDPAMTLDHLCRNRSCVNPTHLEPVPLDVNIMRGESAHAKNARKRVCIHGHAFTAKNTYVRPTTGRRDCRLCIRARTLRYLARRSNANA
jgi:hypothetical protein